MYSHINISEIRMCLQMMTRNNFNCLDIFHDIKTGILLKLHHQVNKIPYILNQPEKTLRF